MMCDGGDEKKGRLSYSKGGANSELRIHEILEKDQALLSFDTWYQVYNTRYPGTWPGPGTDQIPGYIILL